MTSEREHDAEERRPQARAGSTTSTSRVPCTSRTTTSRSTRPSSSAVRLAGRDPLALDDAGPVLGDQPEADEQRAEDAQLDQDPGHEDLVGVGRARAAPASGSSSGPNSTRYRIGCIRHDDEPGGIAQRHPHRAGEDGAGVAQQRAHQTGHLLGVRARRGGSGVPQGAAGQLQEHVVQARAGGSRRR